MGLNKRLIGAGAASGSFVNSENFKAVIYTGNGGTQAITGVGFKPDFVWIKNRTSSGQGPLIQDSTRGTGSTKVLFSSENTAEGTYGQYGHVSAFGSDGFTVVDGDGKHTNSSGENYVAWCWKANGGTTSTDTSGDINSTVQANTDAGFSITTYVTNGSNSARVGHGLGTTPKIVLIKKLGSTGAWHFMTTQIDGSFDDFILNDITAKADSSLTAPNSTTFAAESGSSGTSMICYSFAEVDSFSKFGSYTGNSSDNGPIVETGFEPAFLMIKCASDAGSWFMYDNKRNTSNPRINYVLANAANAEASDMGGVDFLSNGFQIKEDHDDVNDTGDTYIYMAFAADPDTEAPTLASSFNIETWTGTGAAASITGFGFSPNLVWYKERSNTSSHELLDTLRGATNYIMSNSDAAQATSAQGLQSFDSDGFSVGTDGAVNQSGETYVGWTWKADDNEPTINDNGSTDSIVSANDNAGFSIIKYTGTGSNLTVGHGLSSAPTFMIVKNLTSSSAWAVFHTTLGATKYLALNETTAEATASNVWNDTAPTATTISVGTWGPVNTSANQHIAYCFHDVAGYQKFGSYTGNGGSKAITGLGFKPDFVLIKSTGSNSWFIYDALRTVSVGDNAGTADARPYILTNTNGKENGATSYNVDLNSDGFSMNTSAGDLNTNSQTYIYWAVAKNVPSNTTLASSFKAVTYTGNSGAQSITGTGFTPDLVWTKARNQSGYSHFLTDSLRGGTKVIQSNSDGAEITRADNIQSFDSDGFTLGADGTSNYNGTTYIAWAWKAGNTWQSNVDGATSSIVNANTANGFSIVKWVGTANSQTTVGHGLNSTPELIITKNLDTAANDGWPVYSSTIGNAHTLFLNSSSAKSSSSGTWGSTSPTSSVFTVQDNPANNQSGNEIIAYCFHSVSGYSKISSYSGTGSSNSITGLGFQPDWIMIKESDGTDSWEVYDSVRGDDKVLYPNGNNAEGTGSNFTSFDSDGFTVSSATSVNENGKTYIYMAFKMN